MQEDFLCCFVVWLGAFI